LLQKIYNLQPKIRFNKFGCRIKILSIRNVFNSVENWQVSENPSFSRSFLDTQRRCSNRSTLDGTGKCMRSREEKRTEERSNRSQAEKERAALLRDSDICRDRNAPRR